MLERTSWGDQGEINVERGPIFAEQQDPRPDEVVERHTQRHLLPAKDTLQSRCDVLHKELVGDQMDRNVP